MNKRLLIILAMLLGLIAFAAPVNRARAEGTGYVRFVNLYNGYITFVVDGNKLSTIGNRQWTDFIELPAGQHEFVVSNISNLTVETPIPLIQSVNFNMGADTWIQALLLPIIEDSKKFDLRFFPSNHSFANHLAHWEGINAIADSGNLKIQVNAAINSSPYTIAYGESTGVQDVNVGFSDFTVTRPPDTTPLADSGVDAAGNQFAPDIIYTTFYFGFMSNPQALTLADGNNLLRFIHASPKAGAVDVYSFQPQDKVT